MTKAKRILLMEDEQSIRRTLGIALRNAGFEVLEAANGAEGLRAWREQGADLVITDLHMPDKNGLEVILELRASGRATPIIAMSDGGRTRQHRLLDDARLLGAVRTVEKPFQLEEMLKVVREELGHQN